MPVGPMMWATWLAGEGPSRERHLGSEKCLIKAWDPGFSEQELEHRRNLPEGSPEGAPSPERPEDVSSPAQEQKVSRPGLSHTGLGRARALDPGALVFDCETCHVHCTVCFRGACEFSGCVGSIVHDECGRDGCWATLSSYRSRLIMNLRAEPADQHHMGTWKCWLLGPTGLANADTPGCPAHPAPTR